MKKLNLRYAVILISLVCVILLASCFTAGGQQSSTGYATKFTAPNNDPKHPINIYNQGLLSMKPMVVIFNVKGAT